MVQLSHPFVITGKTTAVIRTFVSKIMSLLFNMLSRLVILGEGNGNPLQYSCLENPMGRGAWWAIVHGVGRVRHDLVTKPPPPPPDWS